ncbi:hypothetical protein RB195_003398 [Necator americanus]|uniref:Uncharacterized protein n=1 Tax=Necator americanus TaxID=51031 RepID=A0ABR1DNE2_NECAM
MRHGLMIVFHMEISSTSAELECALVKSSRKTSSYLRSASKYAVHNNLPLCLASAWSSKAKNETGIADRPSNPACCVVCGLDLRNKRCFDVMIATDKETRESMMKHRLRTNKCFTCCFLSGIKNLRGICCGCRQLYNCGEIPSCSDVATKSESVTDTSSIFEKTFDEDSICAASTPLRKSKGLPLISPRITSLQKQTNRSRKRRGSALERLLKEEDSETDRSLSGFLNMVAKY